MSLYFSFYFKLSPSPNQRQCSASTAAVLLRRCDKSNRKRGNLSIRQLPGRRQKADYSTNIETFWSFSNWAVRARPPKSLDPACIWRDFSFIRRFLLFFSPNTLSLSAALAEVAQVLNRLQLDISFVCSPQTPWHLRLMRFTCRIEPFSFQMAPKRNLLIIFDFF